MFTLCLGQIDELKGCIEEREEELSRLRTATASVVRCVLKHAGSPDPTSWNLLLFTINVVFYSLQGATDSEKRVLCLSAENESLKQNLSVTQGLLQQLSTIPSQSSTMLMKVRRAGRGWGGTSVTGPR